MDDNGVDPNPYPITIREVWANNLNAEIENISLLIDQFPCISMDTEYPGVIYKHAGSFSMQSPAEKYALLKSNVDALKFIQLGITLSDADGNLPEFDDGKQRFRVVWQFNFSDFDRARDDHAPESINLLIRHGMDFEGNRKLGIKSMEFAELVMSSGLVLNDSVTWVMFQGAYDVGYLLKILTRQEFSGGFDEFLKYAKMFFRNNFCDVKYLIGFCNLHGGLNEVARVLGLDREAGWQHQAGSDSLLTCRIFYRIRNGHFVNGVPGIHTGRFGGYD